MLPFIVAVKFPPKPDRNVRGWIFLHDMYCNSTDDHQNSPRQMLTSANSRCLMAEERLLSADHCCLRGLMIARSRIKGTVISAPELLYQRYYSPTFILRHSFCDKRSTPNKGSGRMLLCSCRETSQHPFFHHITL